MPRQSSSATHLALRRAVQEALAHLLQGAVTIEVSVPGKLEHIEIR